MKKLITTALILTLGSSLLYFDTAEADLSGAYLQADQSTADQTTYTFSDENLGAVDADRCIIVVAISRKAGSAHTLSSASIGGVSATIIENQNNQSTNSDTAAMFSAIVPTGSTGDIVITWSTEVLRTAIMAYRVVGVDSCTTPHDSDSSIADDPSVSLDVPAGGFAVGGGLTNAGAQTVNWTGLTEDAEDTLETYVTYSSAHDNFSSEEIGRTITMDFSSPGGESAGVFASWAEATEVAEDEPQQLMLDNGAVQINNGRVVVD